jgi:outer membrane protein assembly factor BamB
MARLTLATLAAALIAGVSAQNWMTSHHDNRNSGQSELIGPAERNGTCEAPIIAGSALKNSPNFWNTGVLSATNEYLFVGDSNNVVNLVETEKFFVYWLNLSALAAQPYNPVTNYGIVEAGSNHRILVGGQQPTDPTKDSSLVWTDRLYVPSGDGSVYALNPLQCNAPPAPSSAVKAKLSADQLSATQAKHNAVLEASRAALKPSASDPTLHQTDLTVYRQVLTEKLGAVSGASADEINSLTASPCPVWQKTFAGAVYAPLRYVSPSPDYPQYVEGVVIASETDVGLDAGGVLHGIDAHSGALIWSIPAMYYDKDGVTQLQAGIRTVPAVTPFLTTAFNASAPGAPASGYNQTYIAFFAFGTRVIAVDSFTGRIAGDINTTLIQQQNPNGPSGGGVTGTDLFVSSPTLTTQGAAMFMHSSLGTLWKLAISGYDTYANDGKIAMTFIFACDYTLAKDGASRTICDAIAASTSEEGKMVLTSDERSKTRLAAVNNNAAALDVVSGGFYQPTTRQNREQLYQLLLDEYVKAGLQSDDEKKNPLTVARMTAKDASRIMRALPYETVASLKTASGYQLLAPNSRPVSAMLELDRTTTLGKRQLALDAKAVIGLTPTQRRQLALELGQKAISEGSSAVGTSISLANKYGFLGAFPFATPSIQPPNDAVIVVAQYGAFGLDSALFAANSYDGSLKWGFVNVTSPDGRKIAFGKSRSSPAIDAAGNVYAGTDSDDGPYTLPMVIATDPNGNFQWLNALDTDNVAVGQSSPIVAAGFLAEKRAYMSTGYGLQAIDEGYGELLFCVLLHCAPVQRCSWFLQLAGLVCCHLSSRFYFSLSSVPRGFGPTNILFWKWRLPVSSSGILAAVAWMA